MFFSANIFKLTAAGKVEKIERFLAKKPDTVNSFNSDRESPLIIAIKSQNLDVIRLLITKGADVNLTSPQSDTTPLEEAVKTGMPEIIGLMLEKGANPNYNPSMLHCVSWIYDHHDFSNYDETEEPDEYRETVEEHEALVLKVLEMFFAHGLELNVPRGFDVLYFAAQDSTPRILEYLKSRGGDLKRLDPEMGGLLHAAVAGDKVKNLTYLLEQGLSPDVQDDRRETALHRAIGHYYDDETIMRILLDAGADVNILNSQNMSSFAYYTLYAYIREGEVGKGELAARFAQNASEPTAANLFKQLSSNVKGASFPIICQNCNAVILVEDIPYFRRMIRHEFDNKYFTCSRCKKPVNGLKDITLGQIAQA